MVWRGYVGDGNARLGMEREGIWGSLSELECAICNRTLKVLGGGSLTPECYSLSEHLVERKNCISILKS
jgi:hypothetical protein